MQAFEIFDHTADVGIRAFGQTQQEVFENAALGMFSLITDVEKVEARKTVTISVEGEDREDLLVSWLNELLYRFEVEYLIFNRFKITDWDREHYLKALAYGEELDLGKHSLKIQIKAVTYHMLKIEHNQIWQAQVVFDI
jgi:SHS2 domain-containing protein